MCKRHFPEKITRQNLELFNPPPTSEVNNGKVPGGPSRGANPQFEARRQRGRVVSYCQFMTRRQLFAQNLCNQLALKWVQLSDPSNLPSCNTHPLISCGRAKISDPSPKAPADSQIAQNCSRHRQLLTFSLWPNWQRIGDLACSQIHSRLPNQNTRLTSKPVYTSQVPQLT